MMHDLIVGCRRAKENKHIFGDQKQGTSGSAGGGTNYGLSDGLCGGYSDRLQAAVYSTTRINAAYVSAALAYFVFVNSLAARWRLRVMARLLFAKQLVYPCFLAYQSSSQRSSKPSDGRRHWRSHGPINQNATKRLGLLCDRRRL